MQPSSSQFKSLWSKALALVLRDKFGLIAGAIVLLYFMAALGVWLEFWGQDWSLTGGPMFAAMSSEHWFGTNRIGQDIFQRALFSTRTAFEIGLVVAVLSTVFGALMGLLAGYYAGSWLDELVLWFAGVLDAIPFYLFVAAVAYAMGAHPYGMHVAMIATFWITTARLVRGEVMKLKSREFVLAARAIGRGHMAIMTKHCLPNTLHILIVQATIVFVAAIKSEVILSFLGLGVKDGVSWGLMIADATQDVVAGQYNNFIWASLCLFGLVMAFNVFSDTLQDALDPQNIQKDHA